MVSAGIMGIDGCRGKSPRSTATICSATSGGYFPPGLLRRGSQVRRGDNAFVSQQLFEVALTHRFTNALRHASPGSLDRRSPGGVATDVAEQIVAVLRATSARSRQCPMILPETMKVLTLHGPAAKNGHLYTQLQPGPLRKIETLLQREIASYDLRPLQARSIKGLLNRSPMPMSHGQRSCARQRVGTGDRRAEIHTPAEFANQVTIRVSSNGYASSFAANLAPAMNMSKCSAAPSCMHPRIVRVGRYWTDLSQKAISLLPQPRPARHDWTRRQPSWAEQASISTAWMSAPASATAALIATDTARH